MRKSESIFKGIAATGSIYTIYGLNSVFCKDALNGGVVSPELLFTIRTTFAALLFWMLSPWVPGQKIEAKDRLHIVCASFLCIIIPQYSTLFGLTYSTPFDASLINTLKPIITFVIVCIMGREAFRWQSLAGITVRLHRQQTYTGACIHNHLRHLRLLSPHACRTAQSDGNPIQHTFISPMHHSIIRRHLYGAGRDVASEGRRSLALHHRRDPYQDRTQTEQKYIKQTFKKFNHGRKTYDQSVLRESYRIHPDTGSQCT